MCAGLPVGKRDLAPVPLTIFRSNSKFDQHLKCPGLKYTLPITTTCCTRHDSVTTVTCAKFRCDRLSVFETRALQILVEWTWWWNVAVDSTVKEKQRYWKTWKKGGSKRNIRRPSASPKYAVNLAKCQGKQEVLKDPSPGSIDLFRLANHMRRENPVCKLRNFSTMMVESCGGAWLPGPSKLPCKNIMNASRMSNLTGTRSSPPPPPPPPPPTHTHTHHTFQPVIKAIKLKQCGKAADTSLVVAEDSWCN